MEAPSNSHDAVNRDEVEEVDHGAPDATMMPTSVASDGDDNMPVVAPTFTCQRCDRVFAKRSNLVRHLQRQKPCVLRNVLRIGTAEYALLLRHARPDHGSPREYLTLLWDMICSVHKDDGVIGYERAYDFLTRLSTTQLARVLRRTHEGHVRHVLLQVYAHVKNLLAANVQHVHGNAVASMVRTFDEWLR